MRKTLLLGCLILMGIAFTRCGKEQAERNNPLDPGGVNYQVPSTPEVTVSVDTAGYGVEYTVSFSAERAKSYFIQESTDSTFKTVQSVTTDQTNQKYSNTVTAPTVYYYRVMAKNNEYESSWSSMVRVIIYPAVPNAPGELQATDILATSLTLTWKDNSDNEQGFIIEQKSLGVEFIPIATVGANNTTYQSVDLTSNTPYSYRIKAFNITGASEYSAEFETVTAKAAYTISGIIYGASGVVVKLSGDKSESTTVFIDGGTYSFVVEEGGSYTVTPSKTGYTFSPASYSNSSLSENKIQDFSATIITFSITGTVTGVDGVILTLSGDKTETQTVNKGETFLFTVEYGGSYVVTPSKTGYDFTPPREELSNITENHERDFIALLKTFTLSGVVKGTDGVLVTLSGDKTETQTVNNGETFSFTVLYGESYAVTPSKIGYTFNPSNIQFPNLESNHIANFTATVIKFTISGKISGANNVTVHLTGHSSQAYTVNEEGKYSFTVVYGGAYTVRPLKDGYIFEPESQAYNNVISDYTQDFNAFLLDVAFVSIPGGTFLMGAIQNSGDPNEKPVHNVTLTEFEMSIYEITNAQYAQYLNEANAENIITVTNTTVTGSKGAWIGQEYIDLSGYYSTYPNNECKIVFDGTTFSVKASYEQWPVTWVTWYGAKAFAQYNGYDLPTEAEWEYACRAGADMVWGTGTTLSTVYANYTDSNIYHPVPVGSYRSNRFGLYEMSGNVEEWCHDYYGLYPLENLTNPRGGSGSMRVLRGGYWGCGPWPCRSTFRSYDTPNSKTDRVGFRVVRRPGGLSY